MGVGLARGADGFLFRVSPYLAFVSAFCAFIAMPFGAGFVVEPLATAVLQPHAFGLDRVVAGEPQRLDLLPPVRLACRDDGHHLARRLRLVGALQRELKPTC